MTYLNVCTAHIQSLDCMRGACRRKNKKKNCPTSDNCFYEVLSSRRQAVNCGILACCLPSIFRSRQLQPLSPCPP